MLVSCGNDRTLVSCGNDRRKATCTSLATTAGAFWGQGGLSLTINQYHIESVTKLCLAGEEVGMIATSSFANAVVTKQGSLFTWGCSWGLGHGRRVTDSAQVYIDKATFEASPIIMAACGFSGSITLTEGGGVWTSGKRQYAGTYADDNLYHCMPAQYFHDKKIVMVTSPYAVHRY